VGSSYLSKRKKKKREREKKREDDEKGRKREYCKQKNKSMIKRM
jgi:hypothetical protein